MLTLTENASTIVKALVDQAGAAHDSGLRFSQEGVNHGALTVSTVSRAEPGDAVIEQHGATVFLDETAAHTLGDQVLDAGIDASGAVQFSIIPSAPGRIAGQATTSGVRGPANQIRVSP